LKFLHHKIPPPFIALFCGLVMWHISGFTPTIDIARPLHITISILIAAAGIVFDLSGIYAVWRARTTILPWVPHNTTVLVTRGVYRITRNPMYLGLALLLLAWSIYLAAPFALTGIALFILYMNHFQIVPEERIMQAKFGSEFEAYRQGVRRWV
jgi:protein-S-isoprenylcysteine O-methyltransferase Ste14